MAAIHSALRALVSVGRSSSCRQQPPMGSRRSRPARRSSRRRLRKPKSPSALFAKAAVFGLLLVTLDGCGGAPVLQSANDCFKTAGSDVQVNGACSGDAILFVESAHLQVTMTYGTQSITGGKKIELDIGGSSFSGNVNVENAQTSYIRSGSTNYFFPIAGTIKEGGIDVKDKDQKTLPFSSTPHFKQENGTYTMSVTYTGNAALGSLSIVFVNASLSPSGALATWAIVLIVLGVVALLGVIAAVVFAIWWRKCRKAKPTVLTPMQYIYGKDEKKKGVCGRRGRAHKQPFVPPPVEEDTDTVKPAPVAEYTARTKPTTEATTDAGTPLTDPEFERLAPALAAHFKKEAKDRRGRKFRNKKVLAKRQGQQQAKEEIHVAMKGSRVELERAEKNSDRVKAERKKLVAAKKASSDRIVATQQKAEAARGEWLDKAPKTAPSPTTLLKSCVEECGEEAAAPKPAAARSLTGTVDPPATTVETPAPVQKPAAGPSATGTVEQLPTTIETPAPK